jgi:steroid Delta-isomerase
VEASLIAAHVERFNDGVRTGDFGPMVAAMSGDCVMSFEGAPAGPFVGPEAIAAAYAAQPPDDEVRLLGEPVVTQGAIVSDYAWAAAGVRAGRIVLTPRGEEIAALTVTFE